MLKDTAPEDLIRGTRAVSPLHPKTASTVLSERVHGGTIDLTDRELEVLLTNVYQRIGVADRTQAALWAQRHGLT